MSSAKRPAPASSSGLEQQTKLARKQSTITPGQQPITGTGAEYNIWYNKFLGDQPTKSVQPSDTKLDPERDSGLTRADLSAQHAYICLFFARGKCTQGPDCPYFHRVPNEEDERRLPLTHDVFGRERYDSYREDMGGVGSIHNENRTLYIIGLVRVQGSNLERQLREQFSPFGPIEYVRMIWPKMIGFVRFFRRSSAEFAKEAMAGQTLGNGDVLNIRWAKDDPNPIANAYAEHETVKRAAATVIDTYRKMNVPNEMLHPEMQARLNLQPEAHPYSYMPSYVVNPHADPKTGIKPDIKQKVLEYLANEAEVPAAEPTVVDPTFAQNPAQIYHDYQQYYSQNPAPIDPATIDPDDPYFQYYYYQYYQYWTYYGQYLPSDSSDPSSSSSSSTADPAPILDADVPIAPSPLLPPVAPNPLKPAVPASSASTSASKKTDDKKEAEGKKGDEPKKETEEKKKEAKTD